MSQIKICVTRLLYPSPAAGPDAHITHTGSLDIQFLGRGGGATGAGSAPFPACICGGAGPHPCWGQYVVDKVLVSTVARYDIVVSKWCSQGTVSW